MAIPRDWSGGRGGLTAAISDSGTEKRRRTRLTFLQLLRLWRARHRHRQELAQMSERDLKDAGIARDLAAYEARRWPWQKWNPQWQELDEVLLRGTAGRVDALGQAHTMHAWTRGDPGPRC